MGRALLAWRTKVLITHAGKVIEPHSTRVDSHPRNQPGRLAHASMIVPIMALHKSPTFSGVVRAPDWDNPLKLAMERAFHCRIPGQLRGLAVDLT